MEPNEQKYFKVMSQFITENIPFEEIVFERFEFEKRKTEGLLIVELEALNVFDPNRYNKKELLRQYLNKYLALFIFRSKRII